MAFAVNESRYNTSGFAVGIGAANIKDLAFNKYAAEVYTEAAHALYKEQLGIAETYLNRRTGALEQQLASAPFSISTTEGHANLILNYLLKIRFIDMKKTGKGKLKKVYEPIYNKEVWGFVFGRIYKQLMFGFTQEVRNRYIEKLREIYKQPI